MDDSKPDQQPVVELAAEIFTLTRDLLSRAWGIDGELGPRETDLEQLQLPELAVEIQISGDLTMRFILGVDQGVAEWGALQYVDALEVPHAGCKDATRELANVVCGNLVSELVGRGINIATSAPVDVESKMSLASERAASATIETPHGNVTVAVTYRQA